MKIITFLISLNLFFYINTYAVEVRGNTSLRPLLVTSRQEAENINKYHPIYLIDDGEVSYIPPKVRTTLPEDWFVDEYVDIYPEEILADVCEEILGYKVLISRMGSGTYAIDDNGNLQWDIISDWDIRIHVDKKSTPFEIQRKILDRFCDRLKEAGLAAYMKERKTGKTTVDLDTGKLKDITKSIIVVGKEKEYNVNIIISPPNGLFSKDFLQDIADGRIDPAVYVASPEHLFFGEISIYNDILGKTGVDEIVSIWIELYKYKLGQIRKGSNWYSKPSLSFQNLIKLYKRMYELACLMGIERDEKIKLLMREYRDYKGRTVILNLTEFTNRSNSVLDLLNVDDSILEEAFRKYIVPAKELEEEVSINPVNGNI